MLRTIHTKYTEIILQIAPKQKSMRCTPQSLANEARQMDINTNVSISSCTNLPLLDEFVRLLLNRRQFYPFPLVWIKRLNPITPPRINVELQSRGSCLWRFWIGKSMSFRKIISIRIDPVIHRCVRFRQSIITSWLRGQDGSQRGIHHDFVRIGIVGVIRSVRGLWCVC